MTFPILMAVYVTVLLTELLGDKSFYTISSLAVRLQPVAVTCGLMCAFMLKMLVAVLAGSALSGLPAKLPAAISAITFLITSYILWRKRNEVRASTDEPMPLFRSMGVSFSAVFFTEWGDVGQLTTAALAAQYRMPVVVWVAASLALITKGLLAMALGRSLRQRISMSILRPVTIGLCFVMSLLSVMELFKS